MKSKQRSFVFAVGTVIGASIAVFVVTAESRTGAALDLFPRPRVQPVRLAPDDPRQIVDARAPPYSAIGKFKGTMTCTGAIALDPRIVVTAGHCVTERDGTIRTSNLSFWQGYQAGTDLGRFAATVWALGSAQSFSRQSAHDAAEDWAILILDRAPEGLTPFLLSDRSVESLKSLERQILMPSYSSDISNAEVVGVDPACSVRDLAWDVFIHDCKAQLGSSGAPLLVRDGLRYAIVGIHTGSMYASDESGHVIRFVGNRAIRPRKFVEALRTLSNDLKRSPPHDGGSS